MGFDVLSNNSTGGCKCRADNKPRGLICNESSVVSVQFTGKSATAATWYFPIVIRCSCFRHLSLPFYISLRTIVFIETMES